MNARSPHDLPDRKSLQPKKLALILAIFLSLFGFGIQVFGSLYTGSLALLGDTAHLFTDLLSLFISLVAIVLSSRPSTPYRSFGLYRLEILASFLNGVLLFVVSVALCWEGIERLLDPKPVLTIPLIFVAGIGLLLNLLAAWALSRAMIEGKHHHHDHHHDHHHHHDHSHESHHHHHHKGEDRNLRSAFLHVLSDAISSVAVIIGAIVAQFTQWLWIDPLLAVILAAIIFRWAIRLLLDSSHVLLEGVPHHLKIDQVQKELESVDDRIFSVEDLHIWEITSQMYAATLEVRVKEVSLKEANLIRENLVRLLKEKFGIAHSVVAIKL
jgi:cobalt-zinc-cadmium efflux system protein